MLTKAALKLRLAAVMWRYETLSSPRPAQATPHWGGRQRFRFSRPLCIFQTSCIFTTERVVVSCLDPEHRRRDVWNPAFYYFYLTLPFTPEKLDYADRYRDCWPGFSLLHHYLWVSVLIVSGRHTSKVLPGDVNKENTTSANLDSLNNDFVILKSEDPILQIHLNLKPARLHVVSPSVHKLNAV